MTEKSRSLSFNYATAGCCVFCLQDFLRGHNGLIMTTLSLFSLSGKYVLIELCLVIKF